MPCPVCQHTMQNLGLPEAARRIFWCPRCGTLQTESADHTEHETPTWIRSLRELLPQIGLLALAPMSDLAPAALDDKHWKEQVFYPCLDVLDAKMSCFKRTSLTQTMRVRYARSIGLYPRRQADPGVPKTTWLTILERFDPLQFDWTTLFSPATKQLALVLTAVEKARARRLQLGLHLERISNHAPPQER